MNEWELNRRKLSGAASAVAICLLLVSASPVFGQSAVDEARKVPGALPVG
jgi:hypothetical protein